MEEFFTWMEEKKYATDDCNCETVLIDMHDKYVYFTKQMLIGYMIEFLLEKEYLPEVIIDKSVDETYKSLMKDIRVFCKDDKTTREEQ